MIEIKKVRPMYSMEIETGGMECDSFEPRFASYDAIVTEGDSLDELLDNAVIFISDQDGGSLGEEPADKNWMRELIIEEWQKDGN